MLGQNVFSRLQPHSSRRKVQVYDPKLETLSTKSFQQEHPVFPGYPGDLTHALGLGKPSQTETLRKRAFLGGRWVQWSRMREKRDLLAGSGPLQL